MVCASCMREMIFLREIVRPMANVRGGVAGGGGGREGLGSGDGMKLMGRKLERPGTRTERGGDQLESHCRDRETSPSGTMAHAWDEPSMNAKGISVVVFP